MRALTDEFHECRAEEAARALAAAAPKMPQEKFPELLQGFVLICEVPDAAQLPPLYTTLAQYSKAGCICAVQALANSCSAEADSTNIAPIITPALFERIKTGELPGKNPVAC